MCYRGNFTQCLQNINKLEGRTNDFKVAHNKALVEYYKSDLRKMEAFQKSLNTIFNQVQNQLYISPWHLKRNVFCSFPFLRTSWMMWIIALCISIKLYFYIIRDSTRRPLQLWREFISLLNQWVKCFYCTALKNNWYFVRRRRFSEASRTVHDRTATLRPTTRKSPHTHHIHRKPFDLVQHRQYKTLG